MSMHCGCSRAGHGCSIFCVFKGSIACRNEDRGCLKWHMIDKCTEFTKGPICRAQLFTLRLTVASTEFFAVFS